MPKSILTTKFQIPRLKRHTIDRPRLQERLEENIDKKVVLINAAGGYGKSTLLAQFIAGIKDDYIFYRLEAADSEPMVFINYLIEGVNKIYPAAGRRMQAMLSTLEYPEMYSRAIIDALINELAGKNPGRFLIILDDYHYVSSANRIGPLLYYFIDHAPDFLKFVIATRQDPNDLNLAELRAHSDLYEIGNNELKFTRGEIRQLFTEAQNIRLEAKDLKTIEDRSEGWAIFLQLILQLPADEISELVRSEIQPLDKTPVHRFRLDQFNFFAREIFDQEDPAVREFIMSCSVLDWLDPDACRAVSGRDDSDKILVQLEKRNAFLSRMPENKFRFHSLFREFLLARLAVDGDRGAAMARAGRYFLKQGDQERALGFFLNAGDHPSAVAIIKEVGVGLAAQGRSGLICSAIERLPSAILNECPDLLTAYSHALIYNGQADRAVPYLERILKILKGGQEPSLKAAEALHMLATINFMSGNDQAAMTWLKKAVLASPDRKNVVFGRIQNSLGLLYSRRSAKEFPLALESFDAALGIARDTPGCENFVTCILNNWAMTDRKAGNLHQAQEKFTAAVKLLKQEGVFLVQCGTTFANAAITSLILDQKTQALATIRDGMNIAERYRDMFSIAALKRAYGTYYAQVGELKKAEEHYRSALELSEKMDLRQQIKLINRELCSLRVRTGKLEEAEKNIVSAWGMQKSREHPDAIGLIVAEAELRGAQGKIELADGLMNEGLRLSRDLGRKFDEFDILRMMARFYRDHDDPGRAVERLGEAIDLSREKSYECVLARDFRDCKWMIEPSLAHDRIYTFSIINRFKIPYQVVEFQFFDGCYVSINGKETGLDLWKTTRAMKLLCYLGLRRPKGFSVDSLIGVLWPEGSLSSHGKNFRKTIHLIRNAFKTASKSEFNPIPFKNQLYRLNGEISFHSDLEEILALADRVDERADIRERTCDIAVKASALYKDGTGGDWDEPWILEYRDRVSKAFEKILRAAISECIGSGRFEMAEKWLGRMLDRDNYDEDMHRKIWFVWSKLKKNRDIHRDYQKLIEVYKKELDSELSPETKRAYRSAIE